MNDVLDEEAQQEADAERQRLAQANQVEDFGWVMSHPRGRRFIWRLLGMARIFDNAYQGGDAQATAFRCGEQNVGLKVMAEVHTLTPELYPTMVNEAKQ